MDTAAHASPEPSTPSNPFKTSLSHNSDISVERLVALYLEDYDLRQFRTIDTARSRAGHVGRLLGLGTLATSITASDIREYQKRRRLEGASPATVNRETSALSRMFRLAVQLGVLSQRPVFPPRLREAGPRQGFFEHHEYIGVREHLPPPYQDVLDFAYYSGWRRREILGLRWDEVDLSGRVVRLSPERSKTRVGRVLPISTPLASVFQRRLRRQAESKPYVFGRDDVTVRAWRKAWPNACRTAGVAGRILQDCRRTAARNLVRAGIPERVAMTLTGHQTRSIFDRYNIVNEKELLEAGERLAAFLHSSNTPDAMTRNTERLRSEVK